MHTRLSASIVIPAWNGWALTKACLASLSETLRSRDEVILVDNGSTDATHDAGARTPRLKIITNETNRGFAAACNQGAAVAHGDVVVFLNNDTLVAGHWLDELLAPFDDPTIAAAGPRSNFVSGAQLVIDADYTTKPLGSFKQFVRQWQSDHRGETMDVETLIGFCLAVRRSAFEEIGGFDEQFGIGGFEDDDLCAQLRQHGHRLVIAHGSFVHHEGHRTFDESGLDRLAIQEGNERRYYAKHGPLLSACMIVKNEAERLSSALESLRDVVDEIVVYDTGSTDETVDIARAAGATVIEGEWHDDFGGARNEALQHCRGRWIVHLDADEVLVCDARSLRQQLHDADTADVVLVTIDNVNDDGRINVRHRAARIFRRTRAMWEGRLHEQVVPRPGERSLRTVIGEGLSIRHEGYQAEVRATKGKSERNVRVAQASVDAATCDEGRALALLNLARSYAASGDLDTALEECEAARSAAGASVGVRTGALSLGCEVLFATGRAADTASWIAELRTISSNTLLCDFLEGTAELLQGRPAPTLLALEGVEEIWDDNGLGVTGSLIRNRTALALAASERWDEAADALLTIAADEPNQLIWGPLVRAQLAAGRSMSAVADAIPDDQLRTVLAQLLLIDGETADALAEVLWNRTPSDPRIVAFAAHHASRLPTIRCMEWAVRTHGAGLDDPCPLLRRAQTADLDPIDRLQALAVAASMFDDHRCPAVLVQIAPSIHEENLGDALVTVNELAPALADLLAVSLGLELIRD